MDKRTKQILNECTIYPKAHPKEIKKELIKIDNIMKNSDKLSTSEEKIISNISKTFDLKQRIKNKQEWIKYTT